MTTVSRGDAQALRRLLSALGPFLGLIAVVALFSALRPDEFLSVLNLKDVARQTVIVGLCALGMTFVIASGGIDLSVGSTIALSSVATALALRSDSGASAAVAAGFGAGLAVGLLNGGLVAVLRIPPFIVTLGTMGVARGIAKALASEQKVDAPAGGLDALMARTPAQAWMLVAPGVWILFGLSLVAAFVLRRTVFGMNTLAIGSNEATARLCGVPLRTTKIAAYGLLGLLAGLAGVLQFARLTVGDPTGAQGKELDIVAAVVIGGAPLSGGAGSIAGALVGAFLMAFLANGCTLVGVPTFVQEIVIGGIIILAVALDRLRRGGAKD